MLRTLMLGSALAIATASLPQGQQTGFPRPTLETGPVRVEGSVAVTNELTVHAAQTGSWNVSVASLPPVEIAPLAFMRVGHVYTLTPPTGAALHVRVSEGRQGGWVRGTPTQPAGAKPAWYNLSQFLIVADDNEPRP